MLHSERRVFQGKQFAPVVSRPYMGLFFFGGDFILFYFFISLQFYNNCSYRKHPQFLPLLELSGVTLKNIFFYPSERFTKTFHDDRLWYLRVNAIQTTSGFPGVKPMHNERNGKKTKKKKTRKNIHPCKTVRGDRSLLCCTQDKS